MIAVRRCAVIPLDPHTDTFHLEKHRTPISAPFDVVLRMERGQRWSFEGPRAVEVEEGEACQSIKESAGSTARKYGFIPSNGNRHLPMCLICEQHPEKGDKDVSYFQALREKRTNHPRISMLVAKTGHSHTIGEELLIPKIPLSNNTVQRRIDEMATNVEDALCSSLRTTQFSLQIDELCLPGNEALLLTYVRFIKDEKLVQ
uniref:Uncharacterized protein n=1 Tax=Trichuris muris TaxID=70415 RepID=A0A5S6QP44_TRIMR